jgi:hypothetical protein
MERLHLSVSVSKSAREPEYASKGRDFKPKAAASRANKGALPEDGHPFLPRFRILVAHRWWQEQAARIWNTV